MTLEDIKEGDEICIINFINASVIEFVQFLAYDQFLGKFNNEFGIYKVSEICLDDDKIVLIKELQKYKEIAKTLHFELNAAEDIKSALKSKIFSK